MTRGWETRPALAGTSKNLPNGAPRLLVRSPPHPTEGFRGWLLRLSDANGLAGYMSVLEAAGLDRMRTKLSRDECVQRLATFVDIPQQTVAAIFPVRDGRGNLKQSIVPNLVEAGLRRIKSRNPQVCPYCIAETGRVAAVWDLAAWTTCPRHGCLMIDTCPRCSQPLTWHRRRLDGCSDDHCRGRPSSATPDEAQPELIELSLLLAEKAKLPSLPRVSRIGEPFTSFNMANLVNVISAFDFADPPTSSPEGQAQRGGAHSSHPALVAARAMLDWPSGFQGFLEQIRDPTQAPRTFALDREFPGFVAALQRRFPDRENTAFLVLMEEARGISAAKLDLDPNWAGSRSFQQLSSSTEGWISLRKACGFLRTTAKTLEELVGRGEILAKVGRIGHRTVTLLRQEDLHRLRTEWKRDRTLDEYKAGEGVLNVEHAAEYLGVSAKSVMMLAEAGMIEPVRRHPYTYVIGRSVDRLLDSIMQWARPALPNGRGAVQPWLSKGPSHVPIDKVIAAILEGRLPIHLAPGTRRDLRRVRSDLDDIAKLAREVMPPWKPRKVPASPRPRPCLLDRHTELLDDALARKPRVTIAELRGLLAERGVFASKGTVWTYLSRRGLTRGNRTQVR